MSLFKRKKRYTVPAERPVDFAALALEEAMECHRASLVDVVDGCEYRVEVKSEPRAVVDVDADRDARCHRQGEQLPVVCPARLDVQLKRCAAETCEQNVKVEENVVVHLELHIGVSECSHAAEPSAGVTS